MTVCPVCNAELVVGLRPWHLICKRCRYEASTLRISILEQRPGGDLDEESRETALESLRRSNFKELLGEISALLPRVSGLTVAPRLLDVGSAHGWFLQIASETFDAVGIEPDRAMTAAAARKGLSIREGFFPQVLDPDERFDVIVFNDVLEHIPDVDKTLNACVDHLTPGGILVVNAPNRGGFLYRLSKLLLRAGYPATFERLWQCGFPSPHVHYFDTRSITGLAGRYHLSLLKTHSLPSVSIVGLYARIRYSRGVSVAKAGMLTLAVSAAIPALAVLPPDIQAWFMRKDADVSGGTADVK